MLKTIFGENRRSVTQILPIGRKSAPTGYMGVGARILKRSMTVSDADRTEAPQDFGAIRDTEAKRALQTAKFG
jgi:hypothetical protein